LEDSRATDKKFGRANDLTVQMISVFLQQPCSYCGETELQMTLDRIDNKTGHVKSNVKTCCVRCNHIRRDMPYKAWELFIPVLKKVRDCGAFGEWTSQIHK
jgi:hypothetical protein